MVCKALVPPSRLASILERNSPLLVMQIQRRLIGMAVVWSPCHKSDVEVLPSISFVGRRIPQSAIFQLAETMEDYDVGGVIVGWPVQPNSGKLGGPCGRVLFTLESILAGDAAGTSTKCSKRIFSPHRPVCLWTPTPSLHNHNLDAQGAGKEDRWGRCAQFGHSTSKKIHFASREQYAFDETMEVTHLWEDFWKTHWPEQYKKSLRPSCASHTKRGTNNLVADWRSAPSFLAERFAMQEKSAV